MISIWRSRALTPSLGSLLLARVPLTLCRGQSQLNATMRLHHLVSAPLLAESGGCCLAKHYLARAAESLSGREGPPIKLGSILPAYLTNWHEFFQLQAGVPDPRGIENEAAVWGPRDRLRGGSRSGLIFCAPRES